MTKKMVQSGTGNLPDIWKPFGPGAVLSTEDRKAYEQMRWRLTHTLQLGDDFIEIMLAGTVINLTWEKLRYVRLKKALIELAHHKRLVLEAKDIELAAPIHHIVRAAEAKKAGKPAPEPEDVSDRVKALWDRPPALIEHAQAMQDCLADYERLDKLDIAVDIRLRAALSDFERYRDGLGRQLRQAVQRVIDGEVNELPVSANAAISPKEIPVALVEHAILAPEASNPGSSAVEGAEPLAAVSPVHGVSVLPVAATPAVMAETLGIGHAASDGAVPDVVDEPVVPMAGGDASQHSASDIMVPEVTVLEVMVPDVVVPYVVNELAVATPSTMGWVSEIVIPEIANEVAASAAAMAADPGTGYLAAEIVPQPADAPAPSAPAAAAQSADADLELNTASMTPATINAHDSMVSTTTVPEAVDVLLPDADAQVPPDPSGTPEPACDPRLRQ